MKCPFCKEEMKTGTISQDRYALKWVPEDADKGLLNFTPFIKGINLNFHVKSNSQSISL